MKKSIFNKVHVKIKAFLKTIKLVIRAPFSRSRFSRLTGSDIGTVLLYDHVKSRFITFKSREPTDSGTIDQIYTKHDYNLEFLKRSSELTTYYNDLISSGQTPIILDLGANIGAASRYFGEEYPQAQIISVEPDLENLKMARYNCRDIPNIKLIEGAIGSESGMGAITNPNASPAAFQIDCEIDNGKIQIFTVKEILKEYDNFELFIVKVDIEGFESELFSKNTAWLRATKLFIIETHDWLLPKSANSKNLLKVLSNENRDFIHRGENIFSINNE